jgi:cyclophilin family peptidyl-prolyl cis-trans isomerase
MIRKLAVVFMVVMFVAGIAMAQAGTTPPAGGQTTQTETKAAPPQQQSTPAEIKAVPPEAKSAPAETKAVQPETKQAPAAKTVAPAEKKATKPMTKNPMVEIQTNQGNIYLEVFAKETPIHAKNFLDKVKAGKYDGLTFHRIVPGFVIQGGDPTGTGSGSMGADRLADETSPFPEVRATVAMARSSEGASNCQFYINLKDNTSLDQQKFSAFAKVTKGMDVVDKIAAVQRDSNDKPLQPVVMTKLTIVAAAPAEGKAATSKAPVSKTAPKGTETK